jgi:small GTP-binding protein
VNVFLWDTAGQEQFQALTPMYCHSASGALIVAAYDDIASFDAVPKWLDFLDKSCERAPPIVFAINKFDRQSEAALSAEGIDARFRPQFQAIFFVSALTGESVDTTFLDIAQRAYTFHFRSRATSEPKESSIEQERGCC